MKKKYLIAVGLLVTIITLSNWGPINLFVVVNVDKHYYKYSNGDGRWRLDEWRYKGPMYNAYYKTLQPWDTVGIGDADTIIYRNFKINPLAFWRYWSYYNDPVFELPYKSRKELPFEKQNKDWYIPAPEK